MSRQEQTLDHLLQQPAMQRLLTDPLATQTSVAQEYGLAQPTLSIWLSRVREERPDLLPEHLQAPTSLTRRSAGQLLQEPAVKALMADPALTQAQAARAHGVTQAQLSRWVNRLRRLTPQSLPHHLHDAASMAAAMKDSKPKLGIRPSLQTTPADLVSMSQAAKSALVAVTKKIYVYPVYATVSAGAFNGSDQLDMEPIGVYPTTRYVPERSGFRPPFAFIVRGESMTNPDADVQFVDGTYVLCDPAKEPDWKNFVVVMDKSDGNLTLKMLVNRATSPEQDQDVWLEPLNPDFKAIRYDAERHEITGVVVDAHRPVYSL